MGTSTGDDCYAGSFGARRITPVTRAPDTGTAEDRGCASRKRVDCRKSANKLLLLIAMTGRWGPGRWRPRLLRMFFIVLLRHASLSHEQHMHWLDKTEARNSCWLDEVALRGKRGSEILPGAL